MVIRAKGWPFLDPVDPVTGDLIIAIAFIAAGSLAIGLLTRAASAIVAVSLVYLAHIDGGNQTDLSEVLCQIALVGILLDWQRWLSVDALCCRPKAGA